MVGKWCPRATGDKLRPGNMKQCGGAAKDIRNSVLSQMQHALD